jgi:hypothetical protein
MRGRKKRAEDYEKFGRLVTIPALKKIDGCLGAHFIKVFEARKPEYLWLVFWKDNHALEVARTNPAWREQIKKFEAGKFYKTIPLELVCESLASFGSLGSGRARKPEKPEEPEQPEKGETGEKSGEKEGGPKGFTAPTPEGE